MKMLFISGPYRSISPSQIHDNVYFARVAMIKAIEAGWAVICPHTMLSGSELLAAIDYIREDIYMNECLALLEKCDAIFMLKSWQLSEGAKTEHSWAQRWEKQIFYQTDYPDGVPFPCQMK